MSKVIAILPHFNQHEFIEAAIPTVKPEVDRLIVVDDGSDRATTHASIVLPKNGGTAGAINAGIEAALKDNPDWLTWVSADNTYSSGWIQKLLDKAHPPGSPFDDVGVVYAAFTWCHKGGRRHRLFTAWKPNQLISNEACFYGPCFIIRREVWQEAGPHRGKICHDYDHWLRVEEACKKLGMKIVGLDESLCDYNAHDKRATVLLANQYDATHWRAEAIKRRTELGLKEMLP